MSRRDVVGAGAFGMDPVNHLGGGGRRLQVFVEVTSAGCVAKAGQLGVVGG